MSGEGRVSHPRSPRGRQARRAAHAYAQPTRTAPPGSGAQCIGRRRIGCFSGSCFWMISAFQRGGHFSRFFARKASPP